MGSRKVSLKRRNGSAETRALAEVLARGQTQVARAQVQSVTDVISRLRANPARREANPHSTAGNRRGFKKLTTSIRKPSDFHRIPAYRFPRAAAYHEAGHAVARIYVGAPATHTKIFADGTGFSGGDIKTWISVNPGEGTVWDLILVLMAGSHAEARATKRSLETIRLSHGVEDYKNATCFVMLLAYGALKMSEETIWEQADKESVVFLRHCWRTINVVADLLRRKGYVSRAELKRVTRNYRRILATDIYRPARIS